MNLTFTTSKPNSVYINGDYVTIADSADLVSIILPAGANFATPPSLAGSGLNYVTSTDPKKITGDPMGAYLNFVIPVSLAGSLGDFDNDFNNDFFVGSPANTFFTLEIVMPTFSTSTTPGTCLITITDTTVMNNPSIGAGKITYYIQSGGVWTNVGTIPKGGSLVVDGSCLFGAGTFPMKAVLEGGGSVLNFQSEYTGTITFAGCDCLSLTEDPDGCNKFKLKNDSSTDDYTYTVFNAIDETPVTGFENLPLGHNSSSIIQLSSDGVYTISVYKTDQTIKVNYPLIADCNVKACLTKHFNDAYCHECKCKSKTGCTCHKDSEIFKILPLAYMFYSYVNKIYTLNSTFDMMDESVIGDLQTMSSTLEMLKTFCKTCGPKSGHDCGCGDTKPSGSKPCGC